MIKRFSRGDKLRNARTQFNALVDGHNMLNAIRGDSIVKVNQSAGVAGISLNIDALVARMPKRIWDTGLIFYGKPTAAFSTGTTITLDPCDVHGADNGSANVTAYTTADGTTGYTMIATTTLPTTAIVPYAYGSDGKYYMLGEPHEVLVDFDYSTGTHKLRKQIQDTWGLVSGTTAWVDIHTAQACP